LFGKLPLREESSFSGRPYFLPIDFHDREHLRPPIGTRRISSRFSMILQQKLAEIKQN
jgi:hypothetical protein